MINRLPIYNDQKYCGDILSLVYQNGEYLFVVSNGENVIAECNTQTAQEAINFAQEILTQ